MRHNVDMFLITKNINEIKLYIFSSVFAFQVNSAADLAERPVEGKNSLQEYSPAVAGKKKKKKLKNFRQ